MQLDSDLRARLGQLLASADRTVLRAIVARLKKVCTPACTLNCWEWCEANIIIPPLESPKRHGPYDTSLSPHVRRLMEFISHPTERVFVGRKSSQIGFTLAYLLIICFLAATAPRHVLYAMDSATEAKNISPRLKGLILGNASLSSVTTDDGEEDLHTLLLKLRAMNVWFIGSGAAGGAANKAAGLVFLDELDLYEKGGHDGHGFFHRALERIKDDPNGKFIAGGKPEGFDFPTNINFLYGTREEIFLPCPRCGHYQPIHLERFRYDHCKDLAGHWDFPKVAAETYVECENALCRFAIRDEQKPAMLRDYKCVAMNKGGDDWRRKPGWVSLWVNDLTSIRPQHHWGNIATQFITAQGDPAALRTFFHGVLARPAAEQKTEVSKSDLAKLNGGYEHGCMPKRPAINPITGDASIVLCADNQGNGEKKWVKLGLTPSGEAFVIDYGATLSFADLVIEADTPVWIGLRAPAEAELEAVKAEAVAAGRPYFELLRERYPDREFHVAAGGFIDEGHDTFVVRDFCLSTAPAPGQLPRFYPCKGIPRVNATEIVMEISGKFRTAKDGGEYITVYHFSDDDLKRELYIGRIGNFDAVKGTSGAIPRLWFPAYAEEWFLVELRQEKRGRVWMKGKRVWMWEKPKGDNDYGDALKMCFASWHILRPCFPDAAPAPAGVPDDDAEGGTGEAVMDEHGRIAREPAN